MPSNSFNSRLVYESSYDGTPYSSEQSLERALLLQPDAISGVITHLAGAEDKKFPLTFLTQGKGRTKPIEVNSIEYTWPIFNRKRKSDIIVSHTYSGADQPGQNFQLFYVTMKINWLIDQHYISTRNGMKLRVEGAPQRVAGGFQYAFKLMEGSYDGYVPLTELTPGQRLSMSGGAPVAASLSYGNSSNRMFPGKLKNQISIIRKSYELAGNVANKRVNVELDVPGEGKTNLYMGFEKWNHMMDWMQDSEEHLWTSKYNRLTDGTIPQQDEITGQPIPIGAGVLDQIPNKDTYSRMTINRLSNTVTDIFYGATDTQKKNVVLFTGQGGMREFDRAMKEAAGTFVLVAGAGGVGQKFVTGQDGSYELEYGAYFSTYRHIDGHTITVKLMNIFDMGGEAESAARHSETGFPITSYRMVFLDMSDYDGEPNVVYVHEKGRSQITGVERGMAQTPYDYQGNDVISLATDQDKSSVHFLKTLGISIRRPNHCFDMICDMVD